MNHDVDAACGNCAYWHQTGGEEGNVCRRLPPSPLLIPAPNGIGLRAFFPPMQRNGWCGEYVAGAKVMLAGRLPS